MSRAMRSALCALLATTASVVHAERSETPPQLFKAGETVKLHSLGVKITLPSSTAWTLSVAVDGTASWDVLRPVEGSTPGLSIELSRSKRPDCNDVAADLDARNVVRNKSTSLAPATWDPWAAQIDTRTLRLCTNTVEGPIVADVAADGPTVAPADVVPLLDEVARVLGGRRSSSPLVGKGPVVSVVGTITLPLAGVRVVVPHGWSVKTFDDHGRKVDLLERFEPKDPPLFFTVRRGLGRCSALGDPEAETVERPEYLPLGFHPRVLEKTSKEAHVSTMCVELGPDAVVVTATWVRRDDLLDVKTMLARVADVDVGVGTSFSSSTADVPEEPEDRLRATLALDAHVLTRFGGERAVAGGASLDAWSVSSNVDHPFGLGAELSGGFGYGTRGLMPWSARFGLGPSLSLGPLVFLPLATIGADGIAGDDLAMKGAGTWSLGGRIGVRIGRGYSFTLSGAAQRRFGGEPAITRENRFGVALSLRAVGLSAQLLDVTDRGRLATLSIGYVF